MIDLLRTTNQNKDFQELVRLLDSDLAIRNGEEQIHFNQFNHTKSTDSVVVIYKDKKPIACGCFREMNNDTIEIKRMFVKPENRNQGIATRLLKELENWAVEKYFATAVLETGTRLPEAIYLYKKSGYTEIEKWGPYIGVENSVCMKKTLK